MGPTLFCFPTSTPLLSSSLTLVVGPDPQKPRPPLQSRSHSLVGPLNADHSQTSLRRSVDPLKIDFPRPSGLKYLLPSNKNLLSSNTHVARQCPYITQLKNAKPHHSVPSADLPKTFADAGKSAKHWSSTRRVSASFASEVLKSAVVGTPW
jgi:hypothetical protein